MSKTARHAQTTKSSVAQEWQLWRTPDGRLTSRFAAGHGPPAYVVRAWTPKQAWYFAYNAASHTSAARGDGLGVYEVNEASPTTATPSSA